MTEQRFNPNHAPAGSAGGGQFTSGGGGGGGGKSPAKKTPAAKAPAKKAPAKTPAKPIHGHNGTHHQTVGPLKTNLAFNAKANHGPGYGQKNGDPHVRLLQQALNRLGLTDSRGRRLVVDGKLGPLTTQSIKAAQKRLGVPQDGVVTPAFYAKLLATKAPHAHKAGHTGTHHAGHGHHTHRPHRSAEQELIEMRAGATVQHEDPNAPHYGMTDDDCDAALDQHLAGLDEGGVAELGAAAEEMHGEGY